MDRNKIMPLIELIRTHKNPEIRKQMAYACKYANDIHMDIPVEWLADFLKDPNPEIRRKMAGISDIRKDIPLDVINIVRKDEDDMVRATLIYLAFAKRDDIPIEWYIDALKDRNSEVRESAIVACHEILDDKIIMEISKIALAEDEQHYTRRIACEALLRKYFNSKETEEETEDESV